MRVIENTPDRLIIKRHPWQFSVYFGFFVVILGLMMLWGFAISNVSVIITTGLFIVVFNFCIFYFISSKTVITLDRDEGTVTIHDTCLNKGKKTVFDLEDFVEATVSESNHLSRTGPPPPLLVLVVSIDGRRDEHAAGPRPDNNSAIDAANTINAWLSMNVDSPTPRA